MGVGAAIRREDGRFFLAKRGAKVRNEVGVWEFPGGGLEFGETLEAAIIRETEEEYGMQIKVNELVGVSDCILAEEGQHWVSVGYLCSLNSGEPRIREPDKCTEIGWFTLEEIGRMSLNTPSQYELQLLLRKSL